MLVLQGRDHVPKCCFVLRELVIEDPLTCRPQSAAVMACFPDVESEPDVVFGVHDSPPRPSLPLLQVVMTPNVGTHVTTRPQTKLAEPLSAVNACPGFLAAPPGSFMTGQIIHTRTSDQTPFGAYQ